MKSGNSTHDNTSVTGEASGTRQIPSTPLRPPAPSPQPPTSTFHLLIDPPAAGAWNMAVDEALLEAAASEGRATMRFYQWSKPTLSLGYFQQYEDRREHQPSAGCPVVRRSSGGGAIMHDRELTYSLAVPEGHPLVVERARTYRVIHESLIKTLRSWGVEASLYSCYMAAADRDNKSQSAGLRCDEQNTPGGQPFLCFQRRALGDVLFGGIKIGGSAQRRCRGAVLQHGSVLLARSDAAPELDGIKERSGKSISADNLIEAWQTEIAEILAVEWRASSLSEGDRRRAAILEKDKYATVSWNKNRGRR